MQILTNKEIGFNCKLYRKRHKIKQSKIAADLGYSIGNISAFECGKNDNATILCWYILHGMTAEELGGHTYVTNL